MAYGGVPVATDGEMVYLGAGIFVPASELQREQQPPPAAAKRPQPPRRRVLPGRLHPTLPRPLGPRSAIRSASAHLVGPQSLEARNGEFSPCPSRAQSDGQVGLGGTDISSILNGHDNDDRASQSGREKKAAESRAWRPAGATKLPAPADRPRGPQRTSRLAPGEAGQQPGAHSEARVAQRDATRRESHELFGVHGLLKNLRQSEATNSEAAAPPPSMVGPPLNGDRRAAERRAAREAKTQLMLEERAERMAAQAVMASAKVPRALPMQRGHPGSASAPELPPVQPLDLPAVSQKEDIEKQKLRIACKMEIINFFNGYSSQVGKMSVEQTQALLAKLQGSDGLASVVQSSRVQSSRKRDERAATEAEEDQPGVQQRLRQVNDLCNKVFDDFDDPML